MTTNKTVYMVYHPANAPHNVVSVQSGTMQECDEILEAWKRNDGPTVFALGYFYTQDDVDDFIRTNGLLVLGVDL